MFRVAVIINDNEVSHSDFANIVAVLEKPLTLGDRKKDYYSFCSFTRYNIHRLFKQDDDLFIMHFDSLIVATNSTDDKALHGKLVENKALMGHFLENGKGIFVSSQKKLSNKTAKEANTVEFLPEKYDYCVYDRPEKSSAEGTVNVISENDILLNYPTHITNQIISYHCTTNEFMTHWYRSHIIPNDESQYLTLLADNTAAQIPDVLKDFTETYRRVLLRSGSFTERIVISSMALDWASHEELLENILIYITEGISHFAFIKKTGSSDVIDSYVVRAKAAKMSIREYIDPTLDELLKLPNAVFVFAPEYEPSYIEDFWTRCKNSSKKVLIYKLERVRDGVKLSQFTTETSIDRISLEVSNWFSRMFLPSNLWGNSMWTYNYSLLMMIDLQIDYFPYIDRIYEDLSKHFCSNDGSRTGSYDRVVNATCMMLEVLHYIYVPIADRKTSGVYSKHPILDVYQETKNWIADKIITGSSHTNQDVIYMLYVLFKIDYITEVTDDVRNNLCKKAKEIVTHYRNANYFNANNVVLCKIMCVISYLFEINELPESTATAQTKEIAQLLLDRQNPNGEWRNISETAETATMLLRLKLNKDILFGNLKDDVNNNIIIAIEYLYVHYNKKEYNWSADFGTTAKAMHAIGLFDVVNNFSANDFFLDVSLKSKVHLDSMNIEHNSTALHQYLGEIQSREIKIRDLMGEKRKLLEEIDKKKNFLSIFKVCTFTLFVILLIICFFAVLISMGFSNYPDVVSDVMKELFQNWKSEFVFGFIGIVLGLVFMGIYGFVKSKIFDNKNEK